MILQNLQLILNDILAQHFDAVIMEGDFNARINACLQPTRLVCDKTTSKQGAIVLEFINTNGFILNGRTPSDYSGGFTFRNALGKSSVDLIWVNALGITLVKENRLHYYQL